MAKKEPKTGEITRSFIKHKVYGTVYAIEGDDAGTVLASAVITEATACRHTLAGYELTLDEVDIINQHIRDYEVFEPACSDPKHLLDEIGVQERLCLSARATWLGAKSQAKECREAFEREETKLRSMVREATNPTDRKLPLFDKPAADDQVGEAEPEPPATEPWYADAIGVKRCRVCNAEYPCNVDHVNQARTAPESEEPWYLDAFLVQHCRVCHAKWPCADHMPPPAADATEDRPNA